MSRLWKPYNYQGVYSRVNMAQKKIQQVNYLVVHCAATKPSMDIGVKEIDKWHRERGFFKVGYHVVIRRDGRIEYGRAQDEIGAHARGFNSKSLAVCLVGGVNDNLKAENNFTPEQFIALRYQLALWKLKYPEAEILGHRDLPKVSKECPSFDVKEWYYS